jgi:outer membrane protein
MKSSKYLLAAGALLALVDSDNLVVDDGVETITVNVDDGTSLTLMGTYMFSPNWGFDILASWPFKHDINVSIIDNVDPTFDPISAKVAETEHLPPTFSLQYHFLPDSTFQPYVGAGVNYTTFFSTDVTQTLTDLTGITDIDLDDSFGLALQFGGDFLLGDRWLINVDVRWIDIESDLTVSDGLVSAEFGTVKIDPWVYSVNLGFRF